jgi:flagellar hook-associated protein 2
MSYGRAQLSAGPLAANGTLRSSLSLLTSALLTDVVGLNGAAYNRGALVGVALSKTGTLEVDATKLRSTLATNLNDVKALFGTGGSTSTTLLQYVTSSGKTKPGSYDVVITRAATAASNTGSGFSGVYADADGTPDTMTITDGATAKSGSVSLADGDTTDVIVDKLNALFQSQGMHLTASKSGNGKDLTIAGTDYGSAASYTAAYTAGGTNDGTAQLGFAAATYAGLDVQGTIGGNAATGHGQVLTGDAGSDSEGLSVLYSGSATDPLVPVGSVNFALGVGGLMAHAVDATSRTGDGLVAGQLSSIDTSVASLQRRADDVQQRLDRRRQALVQQFTAMEQALSKIQAQGNWLASQIHALQTTNK